MQIRIIYSDDMTGILSEFDTEIPLVCPDAIARVLRQRLFDDISKSMLKGPDDQPETLEDIALPEVLALLKTKNGWAFVARDHNEGVEIAGLFSSRD